MKITYKTKTIEKVCTDVRTAERKHGSKMAEKIGQRLDEIRAQIRLRRWFDFALEGVIP